MSTNEVYMTLDIGKPGFPDFCIKAFFKTVFSGTSHGE